MVANMAVEETPLRTRRAQSRNAPTNDQHISKLLWQARSFEGDEIAAVGEGIEHRAGILSQMTA